ncbi:hypothetical protein IWQ61_009352 [Dispira simplex]|nr:hypothetical protein IWQ61_009352 [Dispira simplex]
MGQYEAYIAQYAIDGVSILCSLVTIVIVLRVWKIYPASKESPSFNLTLWIATADIPARISDLFSIPLSYPNGFPQSRVLARFFMWLNYVSIFWFIYLTCMIVLDLQLVFFHRLPRQARIRRWYPVIGSLIAFLLAIPYLCFPNVRISYNGALMVGYEDSAALKVYILWTQIWMHTGIIYSIIVVVAVCIKIFTAQSQLRRFASNNLNKTVSRSLIHNTYLIIAYPVVLFVVYVPYILQS